MCPPFLIGYHIPPRNIPKHAMIKGSFKHMRQCWSDLKKSMTFQHFIKFTEAASAYSNILSAITEKIITLPADLQRYDFTYMSAFSISQTLKYQKVQDNTCPNSSLSTRRLQAPTSEDDNYDDEDVDNPVSENVPTDELDDESYIHISIYYQPNTEISEGT